MIPLTVYSFNPRLNTIQNKYPSLKPIYDAIFTIFIIVILVVESQDLHWLGGRCGENVWSVQHTIAEAFSAKAPSLTQFFSFGTANV
jgi:hypothetical protein